MIAGIAMTGTAPIPYKKTEQTPNLGGVDETDDIRGGMGMEGLQELAKFVQEGGTLITEGSTASLMAEYDLAGGVAVEHPADCSRAARFCAAFSPISRVRSRMAMTGRICRSTSTRIRCSTRRRQRLGSAAAVAAGERADRSTAARGRTLRRMRCPSTLRRSIRVTHRRPRRWPQPEADVVAAAGAAAGRQVLARDAARAAVVEDSGPSRPVPAPRVVLRFPANANDMLLSGTLGGGESIANRALAVDMPLGKGHIVMFALRPFWRWQTQGTYFLAFNAILNWDHLDAGKPAPAPSGATAAGVQ